MADDSLLAYRLALLGEAMRPVCQKLEAELDGHILSTAPVYGMPETRSPRRPSQPDNESVPRHVFIPLAGA